MKTDYHVHTAFSDDSNYDMEQVIQDAVKLNIGELCFTDHVDYGIKKDWDEPGEMIYRIGGSGEPKKMALANVDYPKYYETITKLQSKYKDQITIKLELEFGMQRHTIHKYDSLFKRYPFDFIILSVHQVNDQEFWTNDFQKGKTQDEYIMEYYNEILYLVKHYKNYSVLGHLDLINRYDSQGPYPFEKIKPILTEIFTTVISDGKGIEINTSSHRYGLSDLTPSKDILKLYKELGGTIITIGSDSHKPEHLGAYINETQTVLKELGFSSFCTYDKMKPIYHKL